MSEARPTTAQDDSHSNGTSRPQTVLLTKLRNENNNDEEEETSIGNAFFSKHDDTAVEKKDDNSTAKVKGTNTDDSHSDSNSHSTTSNSPKMRPKTVTKCRTDGYQQCLVNIGAVESSGHKSIQDQTLSPKPKSENCYICGKEFLLSSLKIHEKQCAKKQEKVPNTKTTKSKVSKKPQLEACYLCGKEFFAHSLGIHETQCIKNWKANKTPDANDLSVSEREKHNSLGEETKFTKKEDAKLQNVSPKLPMKEKESKNLAEEAKDDIVNAQKYSKINATQQGSPKPSKKTASPKLKRLKTISCYLCGAAFLPHSLKIHEKKCRGQSQSDLVEDSMQRAETIEEDLTSEKVSEGPKNETENIDANSFSNNANTSTKRSTSKKPKTVVCYICGEEFLKSSYTFHEKKCASMNESSQTTEPEEPPLKNNKVSSSQNSKKPRTIVCYVCGEEFLKSSYAFHEKKCGSKVENSHEKETTPEVSKANQSQVKNSSKPRTIVCYICGQEFLQSSYAFHEKQCSKNKTEEPAAQNEKLTSKGSTTRKEKPNPDEIERPETPRGRKPRTKPCYVCGKETLLSSLKVHEQQCQKKTDILKNINQQKSPALSKKAGRQTGGTKLKSESKPKTEICYICGERFLTSSIKVHEAQCDKRWNEKS